MSRLGALKAVTLDAAYSLQMEKEAGSIVPGKLANFTILADNPVTCAAAKIKDIAVVGTVHEGRVFPVKDVARKSTSYRIPENLKPIASLPVSSEHGHSHDQGGCGCSTGRLFAEHIYPPTR